MTFYECDKGLDKLRPKVHPLGVAKVCAPNSLLSLDTPTQDYTLLRCPLMSTEDIRVTGGINFANSHQPRYMRRLW